MGFGEKVIEILDSVGSLMLKVTCAKKKSSYIFFIHLYLLRNLKKVWVLEKIWKKEIEIEWKKVGVKEKLIEDLDSAEPFLLKSTYATKILNIIYSY